MQEINKKNDNYTSSKYTVEEITSLPLDPGVYQFFNKSGKIIYVGKAKSIKKRVSSYFVDLPNKGIKTQKLVSEISFIEIIVVNNESEAFLLENNLIKSHQPKYNILLKDDKTYPYICITHERFPKLIYSRNMSREEGKLYGPFTSTRDAHQIIDLVKKICPLRTCSLNLTEKNIAEKKFKVCLEYHIGNCLGPCEGKQSEEDYLKYIAKANDLLKGNFSEVKRDLKEKMLKAVDNLEFEEAEKCRSRLQAIDNYQSKSIIVNSMICNLDIFGIIVNEEAIFINYLQVVDGAIKFAKTVVAEKKFEEEQEEILTTVLFDLVATYKSTANELASNLELDFKINNMSISVPQIGDKKKLLLLAIKNAMSAKDEYNERLVNNSEKNISATLQLLQKDLALKDPPLHIVCFDNSNIQGTNPVASMVCFKNGKPYKRGYRHFHIKTVEGPDDFASMYEIVSRRFKDSEHEEDLPNLVIIDGGKGQLSAAVDALKNVGLYGRMPIISIAKKLEEIYFPGDSLPVMISKKSPSLKLIQKIRDEAHHFAIEFHRDVRSKNFIQTELQSVPGIGPKNIEKLLRAFQHIENIKYAKIEELEKIVGNSLAQKIVIFFEKGNI